MPQNRVRIIGGRWRSRVLRFPDTGGLRPTPDRVRETVFNWLGQELTDLTCLDLFAGSGAFGLEAASRGAARVALVEREPELVRALQANAKLLESDPAGGQAPAGVEVTRADALEFLTHDRRHYDVAFVDPPYAWWERSEGPAAALLAKLPMRLASGARVYLESPAFPELAPAWRSLKRGRAGAVHYQLIEVAK